LLFRGHDLLVREQDGTISLPIVNEADVAPFAPSAVLFLGTLNGTPCMTGEVSADCSLPDSWRTIDIRSLFNHVDEAAYAVVGYASQILRWQRSSRFCPVCGQPLDGFGEQWMRQCRQCKYTAYPPVTPAILLLIHDGPHILLAHKPGWGPRYSIIAGFVEPGETLEACAQREAFEEVGIEVTDVIYHGNQSWPFPHQLMVGFMATYSSGIITPDQIEIDKAAWFRFDQLPELPPLLSLSRQLITKWVNSQTEAP
jgi:NAD+ diphosphatase